MHYNIQTVALTTSAAASSFVYDLVFDQRPV